MSGDGRVLALSGGVGGAKLALGLYRILPPDRLLVVAKTDDDFEHLGHAVSPDLDTQLYKKYGQDNPELGWGRRSETWFRLGDGDLATHVERTRRLRAGESLSAITDDFRRRLGVAARLLPMSDDPVRTRLHAAAGWLDFQDYFVRRHCEPAISALAFAGVETARPHPDFLAALADPDLRLVVICPSNPFISIDPILALSGVRDALQDCRAPVVAVSPIVGGSAVKGPSAKMMAELGLPVDAATPARHYQDILDLYIADEADAQAVAGLEVPVVLAPALMHTLADREALARAVLAAADRIRK